jgi:chloramphenicol-sensitive protein RarD
VLRQPRVLASFVASALLLTANWGVYIWSVNNGHVIDASLGYFINPLVNVLLGLVLKENCAARSGWPSAWRLRRGLADLAGQLPWIALILGITFGATACCARPPRWRHWKACRWKP